MLLSLKIILWLIPVLSGVRLQKSNNLHRSREPIGMMTSVVKVAGLKTVANALESPNCIFLSKITKDTGDPFKSPSCKVNGAGKANSVDPTISPSCKTLIRKGTENVDALKSPCVIFLGIDESRTKNALTSPSLQITSDSKTKMDMPLSLIVGQDTIKTALILLAVNPSIGGLVIAGGKGTGKSALARALHRVMPPIEIIKGSEYNVAPDARGDEIDDFLARKLKSEGKVLSSFETEIITCPFVQVPVNVMEDRLFGSVDVKKTMETGETAFVPGLLANSHRGILYVDDINLVDMDLVTTMLQAITDGFVIVEREGISVKYPCKPVMIATFNPEDSDLKDVFLDRIGMALNADAEPLTLNERVEAVNKVLQFSQQTMTSSDLQDAYAKEEQLRSAILFAREYLKSTKITTDQIKYLCEEAVRGGCQGHRAEITAARVAKASAALEDAPVRADDLRLAVKLAIVPRSKFALDAPQEDMMPPPPPPSKASQPENLQDNQNNEEEDNDKEEEDNDKEEEKDEEQEEVGEPSIPEEFMFSTEGVPLEGDMTKFGGRQKSGKGGKGGMIFSRDRGRYLRPVIPKAGEPLRVAIDATLREAAKNQVWRRKEAVENGLDPTRVYLESSDIRAKLLARKAGSLLIFCVDASGSMALNRMNAAKGAACGLLQEAYRSRDKIALIPFQGLSAEVLLPPTRSTSLAKSRLDTMPCGGGSPLAHALTQAVRTGINAMSSGDVGRCVIVLISDGRANVPLSVSVGEPTDDNINSGKLDVAGSKKKLTDAEKKDQRTALKDEVIGIAKQIGAMSNFKLLVIDTENKFVSTGVAKDIANAAGGRYHYIPKADANAMKRIAIDAVSSLKAEQR